MTSTAGKLPESVTERFSALTAALTRAHWTLLGVLACELRVAPSVIERWGHEHAPDSKLPRWLEECVARGLLVDAGAVHVPSMLGGPHDERALVIRAEFRALTLRELARNGALDSVRQAGRALLGDRSVASFVTALYSGELAAVERTLPQLKFRFPRGEEAVFARRMLWQSVALPFDEGWLERTWQDSALVVAERVLLDALLTLEPVSGLYAWALARARSAAQEDDLDTLPVLTMHALLRGETGVLRELAVRLPTHEQLAWNAVICLMVGESTRAQRLLDESQAWSNQKGRATRLDAAPAPVLALLAISRNTPDGLALAKRLVRAGKPSDTSFVTGWSPAPTFAASGRAIRKLIQHITAPEAERARLDVHQLPSDVAAWELLILAIAAHVHRSSPIARAAWARRLARAGEAWGSAGYAWFSRQALSLAKALSPQNPEEIQAEPLPSSELWLADLIEPPPEWRQSLKALASFADDAETGRLAARRIAWFIDMTSGELAKPALEEFVRNAGWSRGPRVEIAELLPYVESLPSEDAEVLRRVTGVGSGSFASEALEALCGHPRVFNGARGRLPVEVVRGTCRVETRRERGQLVVRIEPEGAVQGINTVVEGEARVIVYRVSAAVAKLTSLIPKSLVIPEAHTEEANLVLSRLAEHVEIHNGHLEAQRTVAAESTPCLRVCAEAGAFSLELGVRPFGARGRFFPPGLGPRSVTTYDGGELLEAERQFADEQRRFEGLLTSIPTLQVKRAEQAEQDGGSSPHSFTLSEEELYALLSELDESGSTCEVEWRNSRPVAARGTVKRSSVRGVLRRTKGWYIVTGGVRIDDVTEIALSELVRMPFTRSGRFIRLPTGDFIEVERQLRRALLALASSAEFEGSRSKAEIRIPDAAFGAINPLHATESGIEIDTSASEWAAHVQSAFTTNFQVPEGLNATLRSYQVDGYQWLRRSSELGLGVVLADDMGLGKTVQVLALLLARASTGPAIVLSPTSVCTNWIEEIARFAPSLSALEYTGTGREKLLDSLREGENASSKPPDVLVVSYALLQQDAEALASIEWNTAVLDEAQFIKNESSLRAKAAFRLRAAYRVAMTGTPVENHLGDLWSLFHFLNEPLLGSAKHFEVRYRLPIERDKNSEQHDALKRLIGPFILRRTKTQVLRELPRITTLRHEVRLSRDEALRYALLRRQIHEKLHTATGKREHKLQVFSEITRLRRFCCHPRLVFPEAPSESSKVQTFLELAEELRDNGHRALVFSQFVDFLDIVREQLDERGLHYLYLDGGTPKAARHERVGAFQAGDATLFLISLKAGGFGLNLTAADYVIHLDPWWNPAVEAQATDRAHRIGQSRPVTVYRLITKDTIEERIVELHREKRALATALLEGTDLASRLTAEDLLSLLEAHD